jgi:hypothetical protein
MEFEGGSWGGRARARHLELRRDEGMSSQLARSAWAKETNVMELGPEILGVPHVTD